MALVTVGDIVKASPFFIPTMAVRVAGLKLVAGSPTALYCPSLMTVTALDNPATPVPPSVVEGAMSAPMVILYS
jgi:hypothetical protein